MRELKRHCEFPPYEWSLNTSVILTECDHGVEILMKISFKKELQKE